MDKASRMFFWGGFAVINFAFIFIPPFDWLTVLNAAAAGFCLFNLCEVWRSDN